MININIIELVYLMILSGNEREAIINNIEIEDSKMFKNINFYKSGISKV